MTKKTEITKAQPTWLVENNDATEIPEYIKTGSNEGNEEIDSDLQIPRIAIAQALSKVLDEDDPNYIPQIKKGALYNTLTGEVYGESCYVVSVMYKKEYALWIDKDKLAVDNAFRGSFETMQEAEAHILRLPENEKPAIIVEETAVNYCLLVDPKNEQTEEVIIHMAKSNWGCAKKWNSLAKMAGGARYSRIYKLTTEQKKNNKGTYHVFNIGQLGFTPEAIYTQAEKLYSQMMQAKAQRMQGNDAAAISGVEQNAFENTTFE